MVSDTEENTYMIRPSFKHKFKSENVKSIIQEVLNEELGNKTYEEVDDTAVKHISDTVKEKLKGLEYDRYKFVSYVTIGEKKGEGVKMVTRCLWDSDTDNYASVTFSNETLFCVAVAYGVFRY